MNFEKYFARVILVLLLLAGVSNGYAQTKKPVAKKTSGTAHKPAPKKTTTAHKTAPKGTTVPHSAAKKTNTPHKNTPAKTVHKTTTTAGKKPGAATAHHPTTKGKTAYKGKKKSTYKKKKRYPSKPYVPYNYQEKDITLRDTFLAKRNINLASIQNQELYNQVYQWYGVPYRYGGMAKTGTDCAGFVKSVFKAIYNVDLARSATAQYPQCRQVIGEPHEGDLVFFNIRGRYLSHVGIYLQNGYFAHAATHSGVIISNLNEAYYKAYFYRYGAPPTVPGTFITPINDTIPMHIEEPDSDSLDTNH